MIYFLNQNNPSARNPDFCLDETGLFLDSMLTASSYTNIGIIYQLFQISVYFSIFCIDAMHLCRP